MNSIRTLLRPAARLARAPAKSLSSWARAKGGTSDLLAHFYYAVSAGIFSREQAATLAGVRKYRQASQSEEGNAVLLRRNTHRIEKGLLMRPRRDIFAETYIEETVAAYAKRLAYCSATQFHDSGLLWASDVLAQYFDVIGDSPQTNAAKQAFERLPRPSRSQSDLLVPYARKLSDSPPVSYENLLALARRRRSVRWFLPDKVPRDTIEKAMTVALQAPSACNRQPFVFRFFDDHRMVKQVAAIPMGTAGYGDQLPMICVIVGQQRNFYDERDRHLIYIDGALAAMSFCLALETLGLASCLINWPDVEDRERRMARLIGLERDERPVMLIGIGYPDPEGLVAASSKKSDSSVIRFG